MTYALLATAAIGMLGWFFAWWGQRQVVGKDAELASAVAGETASKAAALENGARAVTAENLAAVRLSQIGDLQVQLDAERKARQDLVYELAKRGVPVGDAVVDAAEQRLYPDGGGQGAGAVSDPGGNPQRVPGQPAGVAVSSGKG